MLWQNGGQRNIEKYQVSADSLVGGGGGCWFPWNKLAYSPTIESYCVPCSSQPLLTMSLKNWPNNEALLCHYIFVAPQHFAFIPLK